MATYTDTHGNGFPRWLWPLLALIVVAGPLLALVDTPAGKVQTTTHAVKRHGSEAEAIRDCLSRKGAHQVWRDNERDDIQFWCVELDPPGCGVFGIMVAQIFPSVVEGCDFRERSSYIPAGGRLENVTRYLEAFARRIK